MENQFAKIFEIDDCQALVVLERNSFEKDAIIFTTTIGGFRVEMRIEVDPLDDAGEIFDGIGYEQAKNFYQDRKRELEESIKS